MKIFDISLPISPNLPVWPGDPLVELEQIGFMDQGADSNLSQFSASVHIGTHVDAPHHFMNDGRTVEQLSLEVLTGRCYVTQLPDGIEAITADVLEGSSLPAYRFRSAYTTPGRPPANFTSSSTSTTPAMLLPQRLAWVTSQKWER